MATARGITLASYTWADLQEEIEQMPEDVRHEQVFLFEPFSQITVEVRGTVQDREGKRVLTSED